VIPFNFTHFLPRLPAISPAVFSPRFLALTLKTLHGRMVCMVLPPDVVIGGISRIGETPC
jgi:hypothetical protein